MKADTLVSVLIASYNHNDYIEEAVRSVWLQPYGYIELIVVDDCSSDNSWETICALQAKSPLPMYIAKNEFNMGPAETFNQAFARSSGELITFLASDDLFATDRLKDSLAQFEANENLKALYANGLTFGDGGPRKRIHGKKAIKLLSRSPEQITRELYINSSPFFIQASLFKRQALEDIGCFDGSLLADDWLLNSRLFASFDSRLNYDYLDQDVVNYRHHDYNVHKNYERHERLKIEFIECHTPSALKLEGFSNIYYWAARQRLQQKDFSMAWRYYCQAQKAHFRFSRLRYCFNHIKALIVK